MVSAGRLSFSVVNDCRMPRRPTVSVARFLSPSGSARASRHHGKNRGYGAAIKTGFANCQYEWICLTDGDDEYDVFDLYKLIRLRDFYDLIITFRYVKFYSGLRQFVSWTYNKVLRVLFKTPYRDISTGLRLVRKSLADELDLQADSPFIGAELAIKTMLKGFRVGEVGIQTFPREFGKGASVTPATPPFLLPGGSWEPP